MVNTWERWRELRRGVFAKRRRGPAATADRWDRRELPAPHARVRFAAIETAAQFGPRIRRWAGRLGVRDPARVTALGDGADWIWRQLDRQLPGCSGLLDIFHGLEHVGGCAKAVYGEGTEAAAAWAGQARRALLGGGHEAVQAHLAATRRTVRGAAKRRALDELAGYFAGQAAHLDYAGRLASGQSIGSGLVEGACKQVIGRRLKQTGARWRVRRAVRDGIAPALSPAPVRRLLSRADLPPHRTRPWRTARRDPEFKGRAERVLWCNANASRRARRGVGVVCADAMPNPQVRGRRPARRATPGSVEQQEFAYVRHGTVNLLLFPAVHTGRRGRAVLPRNDAGHYVPAPEQFRQRHRRRRGLYRIEGGGSHIARATRRYLAGRPEWRRPARTPAPASWRNQAELLNRSFSRRYLRRGSWSSRAAFIEHVAASWPEYNREYAHPFEWTWSGQKMRKWFKKHAD
jgi:hypothetical protein